MQTPKKPVTKVQSHCPSTRKAHVSLRTKKKNHISPLLSNTKHCDLDPKQPPKQVSPTQTVCVSNCNFSTTMWGRPHPYGRVCLLSHGVVALPVQKKLRKPKHDRSSISHNSNVNDRRHLKDKHLYATKVRSLNFPFGRLFPLCSIALQVIFFALLIRRALGAH